MVELPKLGDGRFYVVCNTCPAKTWTGARYVCDETRLGSFEVSVTRSRPTNCPLPAGQSSFNAFSLLKNRLQKP